MKHKKTYKKHKKIYDKVQGILIPEVRKALEDYEKVVLCANCGTGKTIMFLKIALYAIEHGLRVGISAYCQLAILMQVPKKNAEFRIIAEKLMQVLCTKQAKEKYGLGAMYVTELDPECPVTVFIPQTVGSKDIGKIDLWIIDEAHEYLDIERGVLKRIMDKHSHSGTKYLGLTGTGFPLKAPDSFFSDAEFVIYDVKQALRNRLVTDCQITGYWFGFQFTEEYYNGAELNQRGRDMLRHPALIASKLKKIIDKHEGRKHIIVVPPTPLGETPCEEVICNIIQNIYGDDSCVTKSMRGLGDHEANENLFRNDDRCKFMVVVAMCSTGWDFPELDTVIDMTFTKNSKIIIQRLSRAIRLYDGKKKATYVYCADQTKSEKQVVDYLKTALELVTRHGIEEYGRQLRGLDESGELVDIGAVKIPVFLQRGDVEAFRTGAEMLESETGWEMSSINKYFKLYDVYKSSSNKNVYSRVLSEIPSVPRNTAVSTLVTPILLELLRNNLRKEYHKLVSYGTELPEDMDTRKVLLAVDKYVRKKFPKMINLLDRNTLMDLMLGAC